MRLPIVLSLVLMLAACDNGSSAPKEGDLPPTDTEEGEVTGVPDAMTGDAWVCEPDSLRIT